MFDRKLRGEIEFLRTELERLDRLIKVISTMRLPVIDDSDAQVMDDTVLGRFKRHKDADVRDVVRALAKEWGCELVYRQGSYGIEVRERE